MVLSLVTMMGARRHRDGDGGSTRIALIKGLLAIVIVASCTLGVLNVTNQTARETESDAHPLETIVTQRNTRGSGLRHVLAADDIANLGLSDAEEQIPGRPWNYQQKFDALMLIKPVEWSSRVFMLPTGVCDVQDAHKTLLDQVEVWGGAAKTSPRLFCGIYTYHKNHFTKVKAIKETWATRCDGFVAFSDEVDLKVPSFKIKHEGPEDWENMWQKSRAIWKYIDRHYKDDYDWFVLGGDDIFLIIENLRKYLMSPEIKKAAGGFVNGGTTPMYLGRRFRPNGNDEKIFNSGGAAYVLNQASLSILASHLDDPECESHRRCSWEDVQVANCLRKQGVIAYDTRDRFGRERFHPFTPGHHLQYRIPKKPDWYVNYSIDLKIGAECCSRDSLSFHYVDADLMRRLYHLVYSCPKGQGLLGTA